jgi:DNA-binding NarL/FixJ family response regulator
MDDSQKLVVVFADAPEVQQITYFLKARSGFRLATSAGWEVTPDEALHLIDAHHPAIVFIDHNAGAGQGGSSELAKRIRERYSEMIIAMMSLTGENDWMRRCLLAGVNDFLSKPLDEDVFLHHLDALGKMSAKIKTEKKNKKPISIVVLADDQEISQIVSFLEDSKVFGVVASANCDASREDAIQLVKQHHPDLVFLDYQFTGIIRAIRQSLPYTGIIMMSVANDPEWMRICLIAGADDFQTKPLDKREIFHSMHVVLVNRNRL